MALFSFLRRFLVVALVFIPLVFFSNSAEAENWKLYDRDQFSQMYYDSDYYHIDPIKDIEFIRVKMVLSDKSEEIQYWEHDLNTGVYTMKNK